MLSLWGFSDQNNGGWVTLTHKSNTPFQLVCFVSLIQTTWCSPGNLPFVFSLIMHTYARGCTCIRRNLKKKTVPWGTFTWSEMGKQNLQAKNVCWGPVHTNRPSVHAKPVSPLTETASFPQMERPRLIESGWKKCPFQECPDSCERCSPGCCFSFFRHRHVFTIFLTF